LTETFNLSGQLFGDVSGQSLRGDRTALGNAKVRRFDPPAKAL
jgi:hypothetical protein